MAPHSTDKPSPARRILERLGALDLTPRRAAILAGLRPDTVRTILRRGATPRADTLAALAPILRRSVDWLSCASDDETEPADIQRAVDFPVHIEDGPRRAVPSGQMHLSESFPRFELDSQGRPAPRPQPPRAFMRAEPTAARTADLFAAMVPVRGQVAAGVWTEEETDPLDDKRVPVSFDPRWPSDGQYCLELVGDSLDQLYPEGAFVHVVVRDAYTRFVRPGDLVVLARRRGDLVERTVKELALNRGGELVAQARSSNPRFREPIDLTAGLQNGDTVEIEAIVIGAYLPRR